MNHLFLRGRVSCPSTYDRVQQTLRRGLINQLSHSQLVALTLEILEIAPTRLSSVILRQMSRTAARRRSSRRSAAR